MNKNLATYNGIDNTEMVKKALKGNKCGLISAPTGLNIDFVPTMDILNEKYNLTTLFSPEHGIRGDVQAGEHVEAYVDKDTNLPVFSMYGKNKSLTKKMVENVDAIVFDIQDVGARYYTFLYTMTNALIACKEYSKKMVVLDRVNPINCDKIEGNVLNETYQSFVGKYQVPARYGMTIGEFAKYINREKNINCELEVVPCVNYKRSMYYEETGLMWVSPSPNIPTPTTALVYAGTCLLEGTNVSEGRGTTKPFEIIGTPWLKPDQVIRAMNALNLDGVKFRKAYFKPSFSKYAGELCAGIQVHVTNKNAYNSFNTGLHLLNTIRNTHDEFQWIAPFKEGRYKFIEYLFGGSDILEENFNVYKYMESQQNSILEYKKIREKYLIY